MSEHAHTRGAFLGTATVLLGAAAAGVIAAPVAGNLLSPALSTERFRPVRLGTVDQFPPEPPGFHPVPAAFVGDRSSPATSVELAYVHATGGDAEDWLAPGARFVIWSNRCTHVGCPVQASTTGFACPCHGSQFDRRGARTAGPAVRALDRFQWEVRGGSELWLTERWSVQVAGARVAYYPPKLPGEPLSILGSRAVADAVYPPLTSGG